MLHNYICSTDLQKNTPYLVCNTRQSIFLVFKKTCLSMYSTYLSIYEFEQSRLASSIWTHQCYPRLKVNTKVYVIVDERSIRTVSEADVLHHDHRRWNITTVRECERDNLEGMEYKASVKIILLELVHSTLPCTHTILVFIHTSYNKRKLQFRLMRNFW